MMRDYVKPPALSRGDTIGLVAPSDWIEKKFILKGVKVINDWGLKVKMGKYLFATVGDFAAGTPSERREDIMSMIDDPEVKVIWAVNGGYAATEVLPIFTKETVEKLRKTPKWFIGYSDVCVLLNALTSFRIASIQGPLESEITQWDEMTRDWLRKMLFGETGMEIGGQASWKCLISGEVSGKLLISNLDSLVTTFGTKYDPLMYGKDDVILGIEEWWQEKSTIQRQIDSILNHKHSDRIKGMVLGRFVGVGESGYPIWGKTMTVYDLIKTRVKVRGGMPLAALDDYGHPDEYNWKRRRFPWLYRPERFLSLPNGIKAKLVTETSGTSLRFEEPICGNAIATSEKPI